jgi:hypothetical protein
LRARPVGKKLDRLPVRGVHAIGVPRPVRRQSPGSTEAQASSKTEHRAGSFVGVVLDRRDAKGEPFPDRQELAPSCPRKTLVALGDAVRFVLLTGNTNF